MNIIKVSATDSTNLHLKRLIADAPLSDYTVLVAEEQLLGRGQAGTKWVSEAGKNLTFSILKKFDGWPVASQYMISMATSLAIYDALTAYHIPKLAIKWPNDILSGNTKIAGILIENTLKGNFIDRSVIGVGLNVNQDSFGDLANVSSLKLLTGQPHNIDFLLESIVKQMKLVFQSFDTNESEVIERRYHSLLYRHGLRSTFELNGEFVQGTILGVTKSGKLRVRFKDGSENAYALKEIRLHY
ncbi:MAG: biotin--[acetyl-CoA-carboxylase] ligase [Eudoraea sp.]|nr:biotin--[acetyl-CoA-carboxylase] ligase [Eudoraea sp.]